MKIGGNRYIKVEDVYGSGMNLDLFLVHPPQQWGVALVRTCAGGLLSHFGRSASIRPGRGTWRPAKGVRLPRSGHLGRRQGVAGPSGRFGSARSGGWAGGAPGGEAKTRRRRSPVAGGATVPRPCMI